MTFYAQLCARHPECVFIFKSLLMLLLIVFCEALSPPIVFWWFCSGTLLFYVLLKSGLSERGYFQGIWDSLTLLQFPRVEERDRIAAIPWSTVALICINIFVFVFLQTEANSQYIDENLVFTPRQPDLFNVPLSLLSSLFLHGGFNHLFGNMLFLWASGSIVERRVGWRRFLAMYLAAGVISNIFSWNLGSLISGAPLHGWGASGAISGVMGIYMVRCYFKEMVFPVPVLGFLPVAIKVRMNAFIVLGLFFAWDVEGGLREIAGEESLVNHWAHIFGVLSGIVMAYQKGLQREAIKERHVEIGESVISDGTLNSRGFDRGVGFAAATDSLKRVLETDPDNLDALAQLARVKSHFSEDPEGKALYQRAIGLAMRTAPDLAVDLFLEYHAKYRDSVDPALQYAIAARLHRRMNLEMAVRALEMVIARKDLSADLLEKCLLQCARLYDQMDLPHASRPLWRRVVDEFPASPGVEKARMRLAQTEEVARVADGAAPGGEPRWQEQYEFNSRF